MTIQFRPQADAGEIHALADAGLTGGLVASLIDGAISDEAVLALRRQIWPTGVVDAAQAEDILAINEDVRRPSPAWTTFFVEAMTEFLIETGNPRGSLSEAQTDWLILRLDRGGRLNSPAKIELLVHLLEKMDATPATMKSYLLVQIERAVISGTGATRKDADAGDVGRVTAEECALLRRVIFSPTGSGPPRVNADEAEMLFRIKDATLGADNAPEWTTLFVQGIANYLQSWQGLTLPSAEHEPADEPVPAPRDRANGVAREVRTTANGLVSAVRGRGFGGNGGFGRRRTDHPSRDFVAEQRAEYIVSPDNQQWLDARLPQDGDLDPMEQALMAFMRADRGTRT